MWPIIFVRSLIVFIFIKKIRIGKTLSENSYKYGKENPCTSGDTLARAALSFGKARSQMEKERLNLMKTIGIHVCLYITPFHFHALPNYTPYFNCIIVLIK